MLRCGRGCTQLPIRTKSGIGAAKKNLKTRKKRLRIGPMALKPGARKALDEI